MSKSKLTSYIKPIFKKNSRTFERIISKDISNFLVASFFVYLNLSNTNTIITLFKALINLDLYSFTNNKEVYILIIFSIKFFIVN